MISQVSSWAFHNIYDGKKYFFNNKFDLFK